SLSQLTCSKKGKPATRGTRESAHALVWRKRTTGAFSARSVHYRGRCSRPRAWLMLLEIMSLTRFSVPPLHQVTRVLPAVAMGSQPPDLVIRNARVLSTYTERILVEKELWLRHGRIAAVKPA